MPKCTDPNVNLSYLKRLVSDRKARERTGSFYADGLRFVAQALIAGTSIERAVICPELLTHPGAPSWRERLRRERIPETILPASIYRQLSPSDEPQGIGVVLKVRPQKLAWLNPEPGAIFVAVDAIRSPGNLGTIIRTMDAIGAAGLILLGDAIDPYDPRVARATMGSLLAVKIVRTAPDEFSRWRTSHGVALVGSSPYAKSDCRACEWPEKTALWLGSERKGLSEEQQATCDAMVRIPMTGACDSLNVAAAGAVLLYEAAFARGAFSSGRPSGEI